MTTKKTTAPKKSGLTGGGFLKLFDEDLRVTSINKSKGTVTLSFMGVPMGQHKGKVVA